MKYLYYTLFLILLVSCSGVGPSLYQYDFPLSSEVAKAKNAPLTARVPAGWLVAEDNECKCSDLWFVKEDYSASLNFNALIVDSLIMKEIKNDELSSVAGYSKIFKKAKYGKELKGFTNEENFNLGSKRYAAYQYLDDSKRNIRVIVFKLGSKYYELSAIPVKYPNLPELYKIQNTVLFSVN